MSDLSKMTEAEKLAYAARKKARAHKKFQWQGMDLEALLKIKTCLSITRSITLRQIGTYAFFFFFQFHGVYARLLGERINIYSR